MLKRTEMRRRRKEERRTGIELKDNEKDYSSAKPKGV